MVGTIENCQKMLMPRKNEIDYSKIAFPSDKLTLRELRRRFPKDIDYDPSLPFFSDPLDEDLSPIVDSNLISKLILAERLIADIAYGYGPHLLIQSRSEAEITREGIERAVAEERAAAMKTLVPLYRKFGLADGPESARELIREIERDAQSQSRRK